MGEDAETATALGASTSANAPGLSRAGGSRPAFSEEQLVAGRFRIRRFVAEGGMGQVYEADDLVLHERVALKTIRCDIAKDDRAIERFKREVRLARKVTHPNVCRIFDVFSHQSATDGPESAPDVTTFLSMEFLAGETLEQRLRRTGRMTTAGARPLVRQMAAALGAAHSAGIVHRDFKSANVMLVPAGGDDIRVVVTDFGLAHGSTPADGPGVSMTRMEGIVGTPAYLAPEQVTGADITPAADLYALGVVMYEMVTGARPFVADTPLATAVKRLNEAPASPRTLVADLEPEWEAAILRCLRREPVDRFGNAADVIRAVEGELVPARRPRRAGTWAAALALGLLTLLALVAGFMMRSRAGAGTGAVETSAPPAAAPRPSVAVLGFKNLSGRADAAWLSTAFSEMVVSELAAGEKIRTVPGESVARMKIELALADADTFADDTLTRIRNNLRTDLVVLGSYTALGEGADRQIRLDLRLQDARGGEMVAVITETGTETALFDLVSRTGTRLRERLNIGDRSAEQAAAVRASLPSNAEAARLYSEGLTHLRRFDTLAARDLFEKAAAADPRHAQTRAALATAWSMLGYDAKARTEAKLAMDLATTLSREERLLVEGTSHEMSKEWDRAIEAYRTLFTFFPDNLEHGLRLAAAQTLSGKGKDALTIVAALRQLPRPASDDPRIDLAEASAAQAVANFRQMQDTASDAFRKGRALGARLLAAKGRHLEGWASWRLGQPEKAKEALEEARRMSAAAGDRQGVAAALNAMGVVISRQGDSDGAAKMYSDALAIRREIGDMRGIAQTLNNIGIQHRRKKELQQANAIFEKVLQIHRETGDRHGEGLALTNLGIIAFDHGNLALAQRWQEETAAVFRATGEATQLANIMAGLAGGMRAQGNLSGARQTAQQALGMLRETGSKLELTYALQVLGETLAAQGDLDGARKLLEEGFAIRIELGLKHIAAESQGGLAAVALAQGRRAEAEALARAAVDESRAGKQVDSQADAAGVLVRCLLADGRVAEARQVVERTVAETTEANPLTLMTLSIARARVAAASGRPADATALLRAALVDLKKSGYFQGELDARLALVEIEHARGGRNRAQIQALERDATTRGFVVIARQARALLAD